MRVIWSPHRRRLLLVGMLTSCAPQRSEPIQPIAEAKPAKLEPSRCVPFAGEDRDPSVRGSPRTEAVSCCESNYGFDPQLAARSCGFTEYLGESEELACVHRFLDRRGFLHELRITPIIGLELEAAIALHESGEFDQSHVAGWMAERRDTWLSRTPTRQWALLSGWSATRRLTWTAEACDADAMLPVLHAMADTPARDDVRTPLPRLELVETQVPVPAHLLEPRATPEPTRHPLPEHATALIEATLHAAAREQLEHFVAHIDTSARWGLPDRRELAGRPILADDGGLAAMAALRRAAARLPEGLELHCPELDRRTVPLVRRGEATMWCMWVSDDHLDMLAFALRGRVEAGEADASIVYIGLFPEAPLGPVIMPGEPPPPPVPARPPIICGDPHAVDYPGLCPDPDAVEEDDDDGETTQPPELSDSASGSGGRSSSSSSR
jgi:hypothetical protein